MILHSVRYKNIIPIEKVIFLTSIQSGTYEIHNYNTLIHSELPICKNQIWIGNISENSVKNVIVETRGYVLIYKFVRLPLSYENLLCAQQCMKHYNALIMD